jgi:hypothetical protein
MSTVSEVVTTTIEIKDAAVSQDGFGVPLIAATHSFWSDLVRTFEDASELLAAPLSVPATHIIYLKAAALKAQQPSPTTFKVGKRSGGTGSAITAELAAIRAADPDFYALLTDTNLKADVAIVAAWAETEKVMYFPLAPDDEVKTADDTDDIGTVLSAAGYHRTIPLYHHVAAQQAEAAWVGRMLPKAPGSANWANKSLVGVDTSPLSPTERATLTTKNVNYYVAIKSVGFTLHGVAASGRFIDITLGNDWFDSRVTERIVGVLANSDKVPYTDNGAELLRAQVVGQILEGISAGVIDGDSPWSVTVPLVAAVNPADKIARRFPNLKYRYVLQGAVNKVAVDGTVLIAL